MIGVVMPAHNGEVHIARCLRSLAGASMCPSQHATRRRLLTITACSQVANRGRPASWALEEYAPCRTG